MATTRAASAMIGQLGFNAATTTNAGLVLQSLTTTQRDALTAATGMVIWNSTTAEIETYIGSAWRAVPNLNSAGGFTLDSFAIKNTNGVTIFSSLGNFLGDIVPSLGTLTDVSGERALVVLGASSTNSYSNFSWAPNAANTANIAGEVIAMEANAGGSNSGGTMYGQVVLFKETSVTGLTARYLYFGGTGIYTSFTRTYSVDSTGNGYFAGFVVDAGVTRVTGDVTNATTTMANITGLSATLVAGRKYVGELTVFADDSTAVDGLKFDFDGGSATATSFAAGLSGTPIGATIGVAYSTAIATDLTATTATTGSIAYNIPFAIVVNAAGTFIPRFSQVAHTAGTATVRLGSYMSLRECPT